MSTQLGSLGSAGAGGPGLPQSRVPTWQGLAGTQLSPGVQTVHEPARQTAEVALSQTVASGAALEHGSVPVAQPVAAVHGLQAPAASHTPVPPTASGHVVPTGFGVRTVHTGPSKVQA